MVIITRQPGMLWVCMFVLYLPLALTEKMLPPLERTTELCTTIILSTMSNVDMQSNLQVEDSGITNVAGAYMFGPVAPTPLTSGRRFLFDCKDVKSLWDIDYSIFMSNKVKQIPYQGMLSYAASSLLRPGTFVVLDQAMGISKGIVALQGTVEGAGQKAGMVTFAGLFDTSWTPKLPDSELATTGALGRFSKTKPTSVTIGGPKAGQGFQSLFAASLVQVTADGQSSYVTSSADVLPYLNASIYAVVSIKVTLHYALKGFSLPKLPLPTPIGDGPLGYIYIAVAGPMTGRNAKFGEQLLRGAQQAVADINAQGGVLGKALVLLVGDDSCDPSKAVGVAQELAPKVVTVVGHFCSGTSIPASAIYHQANVLMISPASTNPLLTNQGYSQVFRVIGNDIEQGRVAAAYINENYQGGKAYVISDDTVYGLGLADQLVTNLNIAFTRRLLPRGTYATDLPLILANITAYGPSVLYYSGDFDLIAEFIRAARVAGVNQQLISGDTLADDAFVRTAGIAGDGVLFTFPPEVQTKLPALPIVRRFLDSSFDPIGFTLYAYAAVQVFVVAARRMNTLSATTIASFLKSADANINTVIGGVSFDAKGDVQSGQTSTFVMYKWQAIADGTFKELSSPVFR